MRHEPGGTLLVARSRLQHPTAITHLHTVKTTVGWIGFLVALGAGVVLLLAAALEQRRAYDGGYDAAKAGFEGAPEPTTALLCARGA
jgi:hypothetical protein